MVSVELGIALALVAANGFFVATEFSLARIRPTQVDDLEAERAIGSRSLRHAVDRIDAYLAACQLGITIASIGLGVVGERVFHELLEPVFGEGARFLTFPAAGAAAFGVITVLHVVIGELSPKSLAIARTPRTALTVAPPMRAFYLLMRPVVDFFNLLGNLLLKPFGIPAARFAQPVPHSEEELRSLLRESAAGGMIDVEERRLTERVLTFGDRRAREIMVPRPEVDYVTVSDDLEVILARVLETGRTRLPICEEDGGLDAPLGLINAKDLLRARERDGEFDVRSLVRPLPRISESTQVDQLLRDFRRKRQHQALVMDEHGTAIGIVTLEDVLEELVGEIEDEFDPPGAELVHWEGDVLVASGSAPVHVVAGELGTELAELHESTIGGHLTELVGRVPLRGERLEVDGWMAQVVDVNDTRVEEVRFIRQAAEDEDEDGGGEERNGTRGEDDPGRPA